MISPVRASTAMCSLRQFRSFVFAGWVNRHQQVVIEYLRAENQSLREQLGNRRILWTDAQRRRLAENAKVIGCTPPPTRISLPTTDLSR